MRVDETVLWHLDDEPDLTCVMVSCCAGAELQVRRGADIVLRELYPDKSTLYDRARQLRQFPPPSGLLAIAPAPR